jgi:hypothetical protein
MRNETFALKDGDNVAHPVRGKGTVLVAYEECCMVRFEDGITCYCAIHNLILAEDDGR